MFKPFLNDVNNKSEFISAFGGLVDKTIIPENCFQQQHNMSLRRYPALSPRSKRAFSDSAKGLFYGLFSKEKLCYIRDGYLYIGGDKILEPYFGNSSDERIFVSMGSRLVVFPDKVYINTKDYSDFGYLEAEFTSSGAECLLCNANGEVYDAFTPSVTEPTDGKNGDLWLDTSGEDPILKQFSETMGSWVELSGTRVKIICPGIGTQFKVHDGVTLSGFDEAGISGDYIIRDCDVDYITITASVSSKVTITDDFTISRKVPQMDFVCESYNRLWGCSSEKNEIYASRLGDPTNFFAYEGISTDSFAVSVGSDGEFTACTPYRGYILFFKENCVHKIYGQNPPYTVTTSYIRGVEKTSGKSLVTLNETLYYKSPNGIVMYDGGLPISISEPFGIDYYFDAVAGALKNKYYVCMTNKENERVLFVYDESKNIWHKENKINIKEFVNHNCNLYFIADDGETKKLYLADAINKYGDFFGELSGYFLEDDFSWFFETGLWGLDLPDKKYYSNINIRLTGERNSELNIYFQINSNGEWIKKGEFKINKTGSINLSLQTPRCDHLKIKLEGKGDIKIFSISRKIEKGSEK